MRMPDNLQNQPTASTKASSGWHSVQFYDAKKFPAPSIAGFFCAGFEKDESAVLIATKEHTRQVKHHLERRDVNVECLEQDQLLVCFDAEETLGELCRSGILDTSALESVLRDTIAQARRRSPNGTVRIFGELVDLLGDGTRLFEVHPIGTVLASPGRSERVPAILRLFSGIHR